MIRQAIKTKGATDMSSDPKEKLYHEFIQIRKFISNCYDQGLCDEITKKIALAKLEIEYQDKIGEKAFEVLSDAERITAYGQ